MMESAKTYTSESFDYSEIVNRASDFLLLRRFDNCLDLCHKCISEAKNFPEKPSAVQAVESLCLLAIQAYAELNRWQEVLTFVTSLYNGIEDCPEKVVQLCILLHSHVQDFTTCNAVAHIWLRNPLNHDKPEYSLIVQLFIQYVLIAQNKSDDIPGFIEGCTGLKPEAKSALSHYVSTTEGKESSKSKTERHLNITKDDKTQKSKSKKEPVQSGLIHFVSIFSKKMCSALTLINFSIVRKVIIIAVVLYILIHRTNTGIPSLFKSLSTTAVTLYKSLFQLPEN